MNRRKKIKEKKDRKRPFCSFFILLFAPYPVAVPVP